MQSEKDLIREKTRRSVITSWENELVFWYLLFRWKAKIKGFFTNVASFVLFSDII